MSDKPLSLGAMDSLFGVHLAMAHQAMVQDFKRSLDHLQLTPKQTALLWLADENPGLAQVEAAQALRVDRATMLGITNSVVKRDLLERGPTGEGHGGRRRIGLHLTDKGRDFLRQAKVAIADHERRFKQRLTEEEVRLTTRIMQRLYS